MAHVIASLSSPPPPPPPVSPVNRTHVLRLTGPKNTSWAQYFSTENEFSLILKAKFKKFDNFVGHIDKFTLIVTTIRQKLPNPSPTLIVSSIVHMTDIVNSLMSKLYLRSGAVFVSSLHCLIPKRDAQIENERS